MGKKVNPNLFRSAVNNLYLSHWYSSRKTYSLFLQEDYILRKKLHDILVPFYYLNKLKIYRNQNFLKNFDFVKILVYAIKKKFKFLFNFILKKNKKKYKFLKMNQNLIMQLNFLLEKLSIKNNSFYKLFFLKPSNLKSDINYIVYFVSKLFKKKISFKRIIEIVLEWIKQKNILGIKLEISGRINGAEKARKETYKQGSLPLNSINDTIDFGFGYVKTKLGIYGIKIWLHKSI